MVEEDAEFVLNNYEEIYARRLAAFGEVRVPPPCFEAAAAKSKEHEIDIFALDISDTLYAELFCQNVSTFSLIRHSLSLKTLRKKKFKADTPEEFVTMWDAEINKLKGFRNLEEQRERHMVKQIKKLAKDHQKTLAVIEMERVPGILNRLSKTE